MMHVRMRNLVLPCVLLMVCLWRPLPWPTGFPTFRRMT